MIVNGYKIGPFADLQGADLRDADLQGAMLQGARLQDAIGITTFRVDSMGATLRSGYFRHHASLPEPIVQLGCFCGTKSEAEEAIRQKYTPGYGLEEYLEKLSEGFDRLKKEVEKNEPGSN